MIRYLHGSIDMPFILRTYSVPVPKWSFDGAHPTHSNMWGHRGGCVSLAGKGMPISTSITKQKAQHPKLNRNLIHCCQSFCGPTTFSKHKAMVIKIPSYTRTEAWSSLRRMVPSCSTSKRTKHLNCRFYFITATVPIWKIFSSSIVQWKRWLEASSPNPSKESSSSTSSELSSWTWRRSDTWTFCNTGVCWNRYLFTHDWISMTDESVRSLSVLKYIHACSSRSMIQTFYHEDFALPPSNSHFNQILCISKKSPQWSFANSHFSSII